VATQGQNGWTPGPRWPGRAEEKLDRGLVAGLLLEVLLDALPGSQPHQPSRDVIKSRLQRTLACRLAGLVTLDRFRTLMGSLEDSFALYYPLLSWAIRAAVPSGTEDRDPPGTAAARGGAGPALMEEPLEDWHRQHPGLLPSRPHRKLTWARLKEFLGITRGRWFGLKDFARHFGLERKTAWEYLRQWRQAGLLLHNQACSAAARYCLEDRFLRVRAEGLRRQLARELSDRPEGRSAAAADFLIATGGEPFWEDDGPAAPTPACRSEFLERLEAVGVLEVLSSSGPVRLLRLHPRWRREDD